MNMPSIDDVFGGTTLKAEHIKGKNPVVTIDRTSVKEFKDNDGTTKKKIIVGFVEGKRELVCNATNAKRIAHILNEKDYLKWPGSKIGLKAEMVDFGGRIVDGIRVYDPNDKIESGLPKKVPIDMDDEIPF